MSSLTLFCFTIGMLATTNCKLLVRDLTHSFNNKTLYWPSMVADRFRVVKYNKHPTPYYAAKTFCAAEHGGTHLDAPSHFAKGKQSVDEIPITNLVGYGAVVDVTKKASVNRDHLVTKTDFEDHEKKWGMIPEHTIVLLNTGWGKHWPNATAYFGTPTNNTAILHFPGLDPAAANWLVDKRKIKAVGIDTASIDYGQSKSFSAHRNLMTKEVPVFENVANLDSIPARGAMIYALPMKIGGGTGAPLRIIGTWDDESKAKANAQAKNISKLLIATLLFVVLSI